MHISYLYLHTRRYTMDIISLLLSAICAISFALRQSLSLSLSLSLSPRGEEVGQRPGPPPREGSRTCGSWQARNSPPGFARRGSAVPESRPCVEQDQRLINGYKDTPRKWHRQSLTNNWPGARSQSLSLALSPGHGGGSAPPGFKAHPFAFGMAPGVRDERNPAKGYSHEVSVSETLSSVRSHVSASEGGLTIKTVKLNKQTVVSPLHPTRLQGHSKSTVGRI